MTWHYVPASDIFPRDILASGERVIRCHAVGVVIYVTTDATSRQYGRHEMVSVQRRG